MLHLLKMLDGSDMKSGLPKPMLSSLSEGSRAEKKDKNVVNDFVPNVQIFQNLVILNLLYQET
jgi:hypothetical protein